MTVYSAGKDETILLVWFFATPLVYPASMLPESARWMLRLNPMAVYVNIYRDALIKGQIDYLFIFEALILALVSYLLGSWLFMKARPAFGDVL